MFDPEETHKAWKELSVRKLPEPTTGHLPAEKIGSDCLICGQFPHDTAKHREYYELSGDLKLWAGEEKSRPDWTIAGIVSGIIGATLLLFLIAYLASWI